MEHTISLKELHSVRRPVMSTGTKTVVDEDSISHIFAKDAPFWIDRTALHPSPGSVVESVPPDRFDQYFRQNMFGDDCASTSVGLPPGELRFKRRPITVRLNFWCFWCCGGNEDPASDIVALTDPAFVAAIAKREATREASLENREARRRLRRQRREALEKQTRPGSLNCSTASEQDPDLDAHDASPLNTVEDEQSAGTGTPSTLRACGKIAALQQMLGGEELAKRHGAAVPKIAPFLRRQSNQYQLTETVKNHHPPGRSKIVELP